MVGFLVQHMHAWRGRGKQQLGATAFNDSLADESLSGKFLECAERVQKKGIFSHEQLLFV
jgi:hypothetical protein